MNMHIEWAQNQARISELKAENAQLLEVINAHNKKMSEGVYTSNEQCAKEVAEHDRLLADNAAQAKRIAHLEYKIDELMLEWCPDEMTQEQLENYANHQRKASL